MKLSHIAVFAAIGLAVAAYAGVFQPSAGRSASGADATGGGITAVGSGTVSVTPDRAGFTFGTFSQAGTAGGALRSSSESVARIVDALRKAGVAQADIQTSEVSLSPRTDANGTAVVGYTATNSVTVTVKQIGAAGDVVDAAVGAGANEVYGPNLLASDQGAAYRKALAAAVAQARAKAESLAHTAGVSLGRVTTISESGQMPQPVFAAAQSTDSATKIEPGTQTIDATVSVTFAVG
jgi:uncharacterized protein